MAEAVVTIVATGASSGLGFEALKQLLQGAPASTTYRIILGCRNPEKAEQDFENIVPHKNRHVIKCVPLELSNLKTVPAFAAAVQETLGQDRLDILLLCAGIVKGTFSERIPGYRDAYIVNCLSQQYLLHLLRDEVEKSHSRVAIVSSNTYKSVKKPDELQDMLLSETSKASLMTIYPPTKFVQLLNAIKWQEMLSSKAEVVAVSPGFVPGSRLSREGGYLASLFMNYIMPWAPFARTVEQGGKSIVRAMTQKVPAEGPDFYLDKDGHFEEVEAIVNDSELQNKWFTTKDDIESLIGPQ